MSDERLGYLLWDEYAEVFKELTGRNPHWAPTSGDYYSGRTWAVYSRT